MTDPDEFPNATGCRWWIAAMAFGIVAWAVILSVAIRVT